MIVEAVLEVRQRHPRMGGRKVLHLVQPTLAQLNIACGRDTFFDVLRMHELLVPQRRAAHRTTQRGHWHYPNLLPAVTVNRVHQVWVADITYILTSAGYLYLTLLTDAASRYIVGYDLSASLATEGCERALQQALQATPPVALSGLIHHSDHGMQYSAYRYCDHLRAVGIRSSMGAVGNCYENPLAERINGILKQEYALDACFADSTQAQRAVRQAIHLYNQERPHWALNLDTPAQRHFAA